MDQEPRPTPQWTTLEDPDTQGETSAGSDGEDHVDEIHGTSSPIQATNSNVAKRSRETLVGGGSERPPKRRRQGVEQGSSGSRGPGGAGFAPSTRPAHRGMNDTPMEAGPSISARVQPVAQRPPPQAQNGSARRPAQAGSSGSDSDSSSIMIVDEAIADSTSQPVPLITTQNASAKTTAKAPTTAHIEISSSSSAEDDSSSSPAPPVSRGVARKSVRGPPPGKARDKGPPPLPQIPKPPQNQKGKEPVKPRPSTSQAAKPPPVLPQAPKTLSTAKGKEPAKPPPPDAEIIELSSDEDSNDSPPQRTPSSDVPRHQAARKTTGARPPPPLPQERIKIRPRVSDPQPEKASLGSGSGSSFGGKASAAGSGSSGRKASASGSGNSASAPAGGKGNAPGIGWGDFADLIGGNVLKGNDNGASTSISTRSKISSPPKAASSTVSVKVAPNSPQKVPTGKLDGYVVNRGKRGPRVSTGSTGTNSSGDVDMRSLPEALGLSKAAVRAEKHRRVTDLTQKVEALSNLSKKPGFTSNDLADVITQAGRSNAQGQSFATSKKMKSKSRASLPTPPQVIDPTKGASVDAPIDLTLSDDDDVPPARPPVVPQQPPSHSEAPPPRPPPLPQRKFEHRLSAGGSQVASAPVSAAATPPPEESQAAALLQLSNLPIPQPIPLVKSVTAPHLPSEPPLSPTRRHTMPNPVASSSAISQLSMVPAITRIASPAIGDKQRSSVPPTSPVSMVSPTPSRESSPIPAEPLGGRFTPPPLDASRITKDATFQSTPLAPQPIPLPRASLPSLVPIEAPKDVPHNQTLVDSLFTDDESEDEPPEYPIPIDRLFDDTDDDEPLTTAKRSDVEAAMEVDDPLAPQNRSVSSELDDVTEALGSQRLKNATPSAGSSPPSDAFGTSASRPATPAATSDDAFDDFYASETDDPLDIVNVPVTAPTVAQSSASVSSREGEPRTPEEMHDLPVISAVTGKSYGGLAALTFDNWRDEYQIEVRYIEDLPQKQPHNHINSYSEQYQSSESMRQTLKASIAHNTMLDEPNAPPIEILNQVDNDPVPPWEFYYTNHMYHGPGVPVPDVANLKGCDCVGRCDPRSKTCQCAVKQRGWLDDGTDSHLPGFVYDKQRRLRQGYEGYPIWECNDLCGCDEDCMNRVVQRGRAVQVSIQKTEKKGWGVFCGPKKIPRGTFLGVYAGEILTVPDSDKRGEVYEKWGRTYLFDIDFYHLERLNVTTYTVDAYHAGNFTRFLNHSCDPNAQLYPCYINEAFIAKPLLVIFSSRDIEPYQEICFNYSGEPDEDTGEAQAPNRDNWKACHCEAPNCSGIMFT